MDTPLHVPQPPVDAVFDPTLQLWVTTIMALIAAAGLVFALLDWRRTGKPTVVMLYLGGGFCMLVEPIVDWVGDCWHPAVGQWTVFTFLGRPMPVWLCLVYFVYFGIGTGIAWKILQHGATRATIWLLFAAGVLGDFLLEASLLHFNTYYYYGHQPLVLLKFPLWWGAVNCLIAVSTAAAVHKIGPLLRGWHILFIIPTVATVSAFGNFAAGWPSWIVINTELSFAWTQIGGIATFVLAYWLMRAITLTVASDAPYPLHIRGAGINAADEVPRASMPAPAS